MALKAKVANKVQVNDKGLVEGTIVQVLEIEERVEREKGKEKKYAPQFDFVIDVEGTQKVISYHIYTRQIINNEKTRDIDDKKDYNELTRLMLQLEVITEVDLKDLDNLDVDVESVVGFKVQFELEPSKNKPGLKIPKLSSIKPLKVK